MNITLQQDRAALKRLVESYGVKDVINYIKHLTKNKSTINNSDDERVLSFYEIRSIVKDWFNDNFGENNYNNSDDRIKDLNAAIEIDNDKFVDKCINDTKLSFIKMSNARLRVFVGDFIEQLAYFELLAERVNNYKK